MNAVVFPDGTSQIRSAWIAEEELRTRRLHRDNHRPHRGRGTSCPDSDPNPRMRVDVAA